MALQGIDGLGALPDQKIAGTKHDRAGLLLLAFHRREAYGGALGRLTDCFRIGHVAFGALDERLDVGRRNQTRPMVQPANLAGPVMRWRRLP